MSDQKVTPSTHTDAHELHQWSKKQRENEAEIGNKVSMQPLELGEGSFTDGQLTAFHDRQKAHHEALVNGPAVHTVDFQKQPTGTVLPQSDSKSNVKPKQETKKEAVETASQGKKASNPVTDVMIPRKR